MALDIMAAFTNEPPELDFIWPGFLAGTVGALVAPGATGKSFFALEAAMSIACSVAGGDLVGLAPAHTGRVVYLAGEDPQPALVRRVHAIGQHLNQSAREAIAENLMLEPIMGKRLNVMDEAHLRRVIDYSAGARLIVLDTLSRIHSLDENSNGDMAHLVSVLEHIAATTGAAVLYLHHVNKGSARDGQTDQQQAARGASALIDNARWCGYVAKMTEQEAERLSDRGFDRAPIGNERRGLFVRFGVSKQNYDATPLDRWYQRHTGGVLLPVELQEIKRESGNKGGKGYDSAASHRFDETSRVVIFVRSHGRARLERSLNHHRRRFPLRLACRLGRFHINDQSVAILHQGMAHVAQPRFVTLRLLEQTGLPIGRGDMCVVLAFFALEIHRRIATAVFRWLA